MSFTTRPLQPTDLPFAWDMLYEAAVWEVAAQMRHSREAVLVEPMTRKYLEGWGRPGDAGVVAVDEMGQPLGAAWYRLLPGAYGYVADDVPEVSIGVAQGARGRGVGGALLLALLEMARAQGYARISLSVDRRNPARRLYERHSFVDSGVSAPEDSSVTLVADLLAACCASVEVGSRRVSDPPVALCWLTSLHPTRCR